MASFVRQYDTASITVGDTDGATTGLTLGPMMGARLGPMLGLTLGEIVGPFVGHDDWQATRVIAGSQIGIPAALHTWASVVPAGSWTHPHVTPVRATVMHTAAAGAGAHVQNTWSDGALLGAVEGQFVLHSSMGTAPCVHFGTIWQTICGVMQTA